MSHAPPRWLVAVRSAGAAVLGGRIYGILLASAEDFRDLGGVTIFHETCRDYSPFSWGRSPTRSILRMEGLAVEAG